MASRCSPKGISSMPINFRISALVPVGLIVESVAQLDDTILVTARAGIQVATCPLCASPSRLVHSRYVREVSDLPCSGRSVRLRVVKRRFCCDTPHCRRRIFAERFDKTVLLVRSRRTSRLDCVVHHLGLALGGRPAASFAKRLMLPVSNDTVLRVVRARARPRTEPLNVVGIDDWPQLWNNRLRPGATTHRDPLAGSRDGNS
jgi:transposase